MTVILLFVDILNHKIVIISDVSILSNEGSADGQSEPVAGGEGDASYHIKLSNQNFECSGEVDKMSEEEREAPDGGKCDQEDCP